MISKTRENTLKNIENELVPAQYKNRTKDAARHQYSYDIVSTTKLSTAKLLDKTEKSIIKTEQNLKNVDKHTDRDRYNELKSKQNNDKTLLKHVRNGYKATEPNLDYVPWTVDNSYVNKRMARKAYKENNKLFIAELESRNLHPEYLREMKRHSR